MSCVVATARADGPAAEADLALVGAAAYPVHGPVVLDSAIIIRAGKIVAVGPRAETPVPAGAAVMSLAGRTVIPGLVCLWADGARDQADAGGQAFLRAADFVERDALLWRESLEEGVTTLSVAPALSRGVGGLGSVLKLRSTTVTAPSELLFQADSHLVVALGMTPPGLGAPRITTSDRLEQYYSLRGRLASARDYRKEWDGYWEAVERYNRETRAARAAAAVLPGEQTPDEKDQTRDEKKDEKRPDEKKAEARPAEEPAKPRPPARPREDREKDVLVRALERKIPVLCVAHQSEDIAFALRLREEFHLDLVVVGATEGYRVAEELARANVRVAVGPALLSQWSLDLLGHQESNAAELARAGAAVGFSAIDGAAFPASALRLQACVAVRGGLAPDLALRAITAEPAAALGLAGRVGTLEPGADADLVVLDGEPLSALSRVMRVIVGGRVVVDRERDL